MTRGQWLWLLVWILIFFTLFCTWRKSNELYTKTEDTFLIDQEQNNSNKILKTEKLKDIYIKVTKDDDGIKIDALLPKKEMKNELVDNYMQYFTHIDDKGVKIDNETKDDLFGIDLLENLAEDFSHFQEGYISYDGKNVIVSGVTNNNVTKGSIDEKIKLLKEKGLLALNQLKYEDITPINSKNEDREDNSSTIHETKINNDTNSSLQDESNQTKIDSKKEELQEAKEKIATVMKDRRVEFLYAKDILTSGSKELLDKIIKILKEYKDIRIEIGGHTDSDGSKKRNLKLSTKRAEAVKRYMVKKGIKESRLVSVGYGESFPLVPNNSRKNKQKNRRVEFKIIGESK